MRPVLFAAGIRDLLLAGWEIKVDGTDLDEIDEMSLFTPQELVLTIERDGRVAVHFELVRAEFFAVELSDLLAGLRALEALEERPRVDAVMLLGKYIRHVDESEGSDFIRHHIPIEGGQGRDSDEVFTPDEAALLHRLSAP